MNIISQLKSNRLKIVIIFSISMFLIGCIVILNKWKGIPFGILTRDIAATAGVPFYTGFFSQVGFILWIATATLCIFSSHISSKSQGNDRFKKFLFLSGLFSLLLCFDDMFLLHEQVFPQFFGISEKGVYATYGILVVFLLVKFYLVILKTDYVLLAMAFIFFGLSIVVDLIHIPILNSYILEDGFKMFGIVSWFFYFYGNAVVIVANSTPQLKGK